MISQDCLPEGLVARCLDVLRVLSPSERDLIRVVVEVVHELRDRGEPEKEEDVVRRLFFSALYNSLSPRSYINPYMH
jgi:hypothetical protein